MTHLAGWKRALAGLTAGAALLSGCAQPFGPGGYTGKAPTLEQHGSRKAAKVFGDRVLVKFKRGVSESGMRAFGARLGLKPLRHVAGLGMGIYAMGAKGRLSAIAAHPDVAYAEPDYMFKASALPATDPRASEQHGLAQIKAPEAWSLTRGDKRVTVAVLDTGVDLDHPDLRANLTSGYNAVDPTSAPEDDNGHGTHVAGIIAASGDNGVGGVGVAPGCSLMPVKALMANSSGRMSDIVVGLIWAVDHGADIVNMSLGGPVNTPALREAVEYALGKGVVLVAAMGNLEGEESPNTMNYPAAVPGVIGVVNLDEQDGLSYSSYYGSWGSVAAPGENILSTYPDDDYMHESGTSMAAPYVAGVAALMLSLNPGMTPAAVKRRLERTAADLGEPGFDEQFGHGRIDAHRALVGR